MDSKKKTVIKQMILSKREKAKNKSNIDPPISYFSKKSSAREINHVLTILAPRAKALNTSVPYLTPPSKYTSAFSATAFTISGRASIWNWKTIE